ncbi:outer membrane protein assembly factor BamE [Novosphingobium sp.]|uniref:outer membrane protein assembly factor BamE n=1 Tax=Novosphingobium sp. TaxID=1874826 RepID=UPI0035B3D229
MPFAGSKLRMAVLGTGLVLALGACSSIKDHRGYIVDQALLDSVQPGIDNQESVERTLGRPTFVSEFGRKDWYYVSQNTRQAAFSRPRANEQLILRIRFDDKGNVLAIDKAGLEKVVQLDPDGKKTPTLGKDRSFIEDLFGNIGTVGTGARGPGGGAGGGPNGS